MFNLAQFLTSPFFIFMVGGFLGLTIDGVGQFYGDQPWFPLVSLFLAFAVQLFDYWRAKATAPVMRGAGDAKPTVARLVFGYGK